ncbi:MAG: hypothetical protein IH587_12905 [Anaerolineae bacterium]|nr:hypothetical protein [Anaerolineae bacterium]
MTMPLYCDLSALTEDQRARQAQILEQMLHARAEIREYDDGYGWRHPVHFLRDVAEYIHAERLCCPFFDFALRIEPLSDWLWLDLRGGDNVKGFLKEGGFGTG